MDSQFHMAGEASQSWWKVKGTSHMVADKGRELVQGTLLYKTIRSHETYSLSQNNMGKTCPHESITWHQAPPTTWRNYGSYNLRFGWGHSQTISIAYD